MHEWTLKGSGAHPFHLHLYHMLVVTPGGCGAHEFGEFYDTISASGDCKVRFRTADFGQVNHKYMIFPDTYECFLRKPDNLI